MTVPFVALNRAQCERTEVKNKQNDAKKPAAKHDGDREFYLNYLAYQNHRAVSIDTSFSVIDTGIARRFA